jgi:hypothetical protein
MMSQKYLAKAKIGDTIKIIGFSGDCYESELKLIGATGVVEYIDDLGAIHGTWGGLSLLPEDDYIVIKKAENE